MQELIELCLFRIKCKFKSFQQLSENLLKTLKCRKVLTFLYEGRKMLMVRRSGMRFRRSGGYTIRTSQSGDCYINGQSIPDNHQVVLHDGEPVRIYAHLKPDTIISFKFRRDGQEWRRVYHVTDQKVFVGRARSKQHQGAV